MTRTRRTSPIFGLGGPPRIHSRHIDTGDTATNVLKLIATFEILIATKYNYPHYVNQSEAFLFRKSIRSINILPIYKYRIESSYWPRETKIAKQSKADENFLNTPTNSPEIGSAPADSKNAILSAC